MLQQVGTRMLRLIPVFVLITVLATVALDFMPGSAATAILGNDATPEEVALLNAKLGLDQPFVFRYLGWLGSTFQGDLGTSIRLGTPVTEVLAQRFPVTAEIAVLGMLIAFVISVPLALITGANAGRALDRFCSGISSTLLSIPSFAAAVILIYIFAIQLRWFPVSGWVPLTEDPWNNFKYAFLPALVLGLMEAAVFYRLLRGDVISTLRETFVLSARARGLSKAYVLTRHVLRPSLFSLVTVMGLSLGRLLGGALIVESLFALPGLGTLMLQSVPSRDIPVIQGVVLLIALIYVIVNVAVDLGYSVIDPRVRVRNTV